MGFLDAFSSAVGRTSDRLGSYADASTITPRIRQALASYTDVSVRPPASNSRANVYLVMAKGDQADVDAIWDLANREVGTYPLVVWVGSTDDEGWLTDSIRRDADLLPAPCGRSKAFARWFSGALG